MKVSDYVADTLAKAGAEVCFSVTGGGAMHLNDSFGENSNFDCIYMHHEQAAAMAAEGYARISGKPAVLNVTTGPGALNSLNGIFGAYTDSIPMIVIAGQVRTDTISTNFDNPKLRQLGDQELRSIPVVREMTKFAIQITSPEHLVEHLDLAIKLASSGRPGPVWIEIPVDIQGLDFDFDSYKKLIDGNSSALCSDQLTDSILDSELLDLIEKIKCAKRPVVLAGSGIRLSNSQEKLIEFAETLNVPIVTAWMHDIIDSNHPLYAGRAGTIGTRPGNFAVQYSDLILILGSRLNIRQVSYNWENFAPLAEKFWVDIDSAEFKKPYIKVDKTFHADLKPFLNRLVELAKCVNNESHAEWVAWCQKIRKEFEPKLSDYESTNYGINAYHLIPEIFEHASESDIFVCGNATACIVPFQVGNLKNGMRLFSNSGSASMGYDLPAAIGAALADKTRNVNCFAGDGSIMMNLQELETLKNLNLNVKIFVLNNDGYLSIKQTQKNFFGHDHGASPSSGLSFPDFCLIGNAFKIRTVVLDPMSNWKQSIDQVMRISGPIIVVCPLEKNQEFAPRLKSRIDNGKILTPSLEDMFPYLEEKILMEIKNSALSIN